MPGLITNYLFGERAYQSLSPNHLKEIIRKNPNAYRMGLQGPAHDGNASRFRLQGRFQEKGTQNAQQDCQAGRESQKEKITVFPQRCRSSLRSKGLVKYE